MAKDRFSNLDLNLLKTLVVLFQELNMRKASTRLNVTQPAISQALQKLRYHFDDELFVKVRSGLEPTSFTVELIERITPHIDGLAQAVNSLNEFNPQYLDHNVSIICTSVVESSLIGRLYERVRELAPSLQLEFASWGEDSLQQLIKGTSLLAIGYENKDFKEVYSQRLLDIDGVLIVRKDHPLSGRVIELEELQGAEFASFVTKGWNDNRVVIADVLAKQNINIQVGVRSELLYPVIDIVRRSDAIMAHSTIFPFLAFPELTPLKVNVDRSVTKVPLYIHYHVKDRNNPLIKWLINIISSELKQQIADNKCLLD
ncbi:hypothetical protein A9264_10880 [Vibrio sp. UCD-FRSSP16_10]|uniref:LysR family transcriptional regulator n=1 Tax=unclassified Vibrio TaxID=2614977 RepID=UPI00080104FD|nr:MULTISPECIES: LysR family transcriptional regulator [unclassified Vibrio]OBT16766.1 hypothetical protein A9260_11100 [Vibrio sp. UCD-FRSSP16_30]OBT21393.1 hypothetical protein A9264_10880 [Vibrio sp. UCD-FRSSP16_10]